MFIPEFMDGFPPILSMLMTIFWVWMLIHCARNNTLRNKIWWILFIIFLQPFGGIVYFFVRGPWLKVKKYLWTQASSPIYQAPRIYQAPPASQPRQETYTAYEQGYQAQPAPAFQENEQPYYTPSSLQPQYEQPEIPYPEPPQVQQS